VLVLAALLVGTASAELPVTDGLVAAYDFRQGADPATLYDISGNGHNGTITGGATWTAEGLLFDGVDDCVNIGNIGSLAEGYTIFAAVKTTSGGLQSVVSRTGPGGQHTQETVPDSTCGGPVPVHGDDPIRWCRPHVCQIQPGASADQQLADIGREM